VAGGQGVRPTNVRSSSPVRVTVWTSCLTNPGLIGRNGHPFRLFEENSEPICDRLDHEAAHDLAAPQGVEREAKNVASLTGADKEHESPAASHFPSRAHNV
jgi:hypothetical protein